MSSNSHVCWGIQTLVVGWSALSAPCFTPCTVGITRHDHLLLCTEEVVRCGQWGGKGEMNARRTTLTSLRISDLSPLSKNEPAHIPRSVSLLSDLCCCRQICGAVVQLSSNPWRCRPTHVIVVESASSGFRRCVASQPAVLSSNSYRSCRMRRPAFVIEPVGRGVVTNSRCCRSRVVRLSFLNPWRYHRTGVLSGHHRLRCDCEWAVHVDDWLCMSLLGGIRHEWGVVDIVRWYASSMEGVCSVVVVEPVSSGFRCARWSFVEVGVCRERVRKI